MFVVVLLLYVFVQYVLASCFSVRPIDTCIHYMFVVVLLFYVFDALHAVVVLLLYVFETLHAC